MMRRLSRVAVAGVTFAALGVVGAIGSTGAAAGPSNSAAAGGPVQPLFAVMHTGGRTASPQTTPPTWNFKYQYQGTTYKELFIGTNPKTGTSTTVPTYIIPLKMVSGTTKENPTKPINGGDSAVQQTVASPIFQRGVDFVLGGQNIGSTQYEDAFQRASFWSTVKTHTGYHMLLGQPTIEPETTLNVPSNEGGVFTVFGIQVIVADLNWFDAQIEPLMTSLHLPATSLPIFVVTQTYLSGSNNLSGCCIGGYHNYNGTQAYSEFSYIQQSGVFSQDVSALSHEAGEWMDDPLTNNTDVPPSCGIYEVGDPLELEANYGDYPYKLDGFTYHLQDLVTPPYFGAPPSTSVGKRFTFQGTKLSVCQNGG